MAVFKRRQCKGCGRVTEEPKPVKKAPSCEKCGGETAYSDKWWVSVRMPDEKGRTRKVRRAVSTNKQFTIEYEGKLLGKRGDGEYLESRRRVRLEKLTQLFLEDCERRVLEGNLAKRTSDFYRQMLENFVVPWFGKDRDAKKISELDVEGYKSARLSANRRVHVGKGETRELDRKIRPATVNRELSALRAAFSFGVRRRLLTENPVKRVETLKENNRRDRFLEPKEIDNLLSKCEAPHLKIAVMLALEAGLRLENCLTIKWGEIDFKRNELIKVGKGRKKIQVPLTQKLRACLLAHQKAQKVKSFSGYVIPSPARKKDTDKADSPMRIDANFGFASACKRAGIEDFTFHDLRHTFVSLFLARTNGDIWTCSQIVGHSTAYMTERYGHLLDHRRREVMKKFESG